MQMDSQVQHRAGNRIEAVLKNGMAPKKRLKKNLKREGQHLRVNQSVGRMRDRHRSDPEPRARLDLL